MKKYHVKKGDKVVVNSGNFKGEEATISAILTKKDRVVLEINSIPQEKLAARLGKKTIKKSAANPKGGLVDRAVSVHVSNVRKKD